MSLPTHIDRDTLFLKEYYRLQIFLNDTILNTVINDSNRIIIVSKHQFVTLYFMISRPATRCPFRARYP